MEIEEKSEEAMLMSFISGGSIITVLLFVVVTGFSERGFNDPFRLYATIYSIGLSFTLIAAYRNKAKLSSIML